MNGPRFCALAAIKRSYQCVFLFFLRKQSMSAFKFAWSRKEKFAVGFIGVLILAVASAAAFRSRRPPAPPKTPVVPAIQQIALAEGRDKSKVEVLPIQLKSQGFVPREIKRPAGDYLFSVSNQSGSDEIDLTFQAEQRGRLSETRIKKERLRWRQKLSLTPGTYLLTEANHPDWVCRIVISSK